jgi:uncharacterized protein YndB with AHSA1/START domain
LRLTLAKEDPMSEKIEREVVVEAPAQEVWDAVTGDGWLAERVLLDLRPGGDACFESGDEVKAGWVEDVLAPERLVFWWGTDDEPATRVELELTPGEEGTVLRVVESRPLELLDLVGTPLRHAGRKTFGPALVAA